MDTPKPTMQMYSFVQDAYDFFNDNLILRFSLHINHWN